MKHVLFTGLAVAALMLAVVTLGRDSPVRLAENAPSAASEDASIHAYGDSNQTCQEWTDGCRTCSRPQSGDLFCSNMPIACQPKTISCARQVEPPKPEAPKPEPAKSEPAKP
jgi:hypothetical protein